MHVLGVNLRNSVYTSNKGSLKRPLNSKNFKANMGNDYFVMSQRVKQISFSGYKLAILDGGTHLNDLAHFAKAVNPDIDITEIGLRVNPVDSAVKQAESLKNALKRVNSSRKEEKPGYMAIPVVCSVPLLNLSDQVNAVCGKNIQLIPQNLRSHKKDIINFLKMIAKKPSDYQTHIRYMDSIGQGIEHVFGIIQEINKAVKSGVKVYIPAGHPEHLTLKWMADTRNLKPELYHFISTGEDLNGSVQSMRRVIQGNNWYDFNLLSLSNAKTVNLQDVQGGEHLYSAYDGFTTTGARGVYNFTPIRKGEKLEGFSFLDEINVNYPLSAHTSEENIFNITRFVGLPLKKVLATNREHEEFRQYLKGSYRQNPDKFLRLIFKVDEIFSPAEMDGKKVKLQGDYVDSSLKLFFRTNKDGNVIFPKCDYEQSGRPSVKSMWGSCFSVINAIKRDMELQKK